MKKVAVIIDGGFTKKIFQKFFQSPDVPTANQIVDLANGIIKDDEELFRIYYYDCPPFGKKLNKPITNDVFKNKELINKGNKYLRDLSLKKNIAYRRGELKFMGWSLIDYKLKEIISKNRELKDDDFFPVFRQKRVDMKIGLDIAWLSIRKIVDRIIIIAGDSDFIPAMKLARIEGVQIIVAPLGNPINSDMEEHSDEMRDYDISNLRLNC
jgi:uncharacterized LabA/DUF88 family protein